MELSPCEKAIIVPAALKSFSLELVCELNAVMYYVIEGKYVESSPVFVSLVRDKKNNLYKIAAVSEKAKILWHIRLPCTLKKLKSPKKKHVLFSFKPENPLDSTVEIRGFQFLKGGAVSNFIKRIETINKIKNNPPSAELNSKLHTCDNNNKTNKGASVKEVSFPKTLRSNSVFSSQSALHNLSFPAKPSYPITTKRVPSVDNLTLSKSLTSSTSQDLTVGRNRSVPAKESLEIVTDLERRRLINRLNIETAKYQRKLKELELQNSKVLQERDSYLEQQRIEKELEILKQTQLLQEELEKQKKSLEETQRVQLAKHQELIELARKETERLVKQRNELEEKLKEETFKHKQALEEEKLKLTIAAQQVNSSKILEPHKQTLGEQTLEEEGEKIIIAAQQVNSSKILESRTLLKPVDHLENGGVTVTPDLSLKLSHPSAPPSPSTLEQSYKLFPKLCFSAEDLTEGSKKLKKQHATLLPAEGVSLTTLKADENPLAAILHALDKRASVMHDEDGDVDDFLDNWG